jgi:hypothetical protein
MATGEGNSGIRAWCGQKNAEDSVAQHGTRDRRIGGFFGAGARAALPLHGAAFFLYFKKLARFAKLATS